VGISPDANVFLEWKFVVINATLVWTWLVMALMVLGSWLITRKLSSGPEISRFQNLLEVIVDYTRSQIGEIARRQPERFLPFIGSLFLFIAVSNLLGIIPGFEPPTGSLSTTTGLAICVFAAVPLFGMTSRGLGPYLKQYLKPSPFMLPFNVIGELSRTLALAVRLFGNVMSGAKIVAILLAITPIIFPVVMQLFGLLTGIIQAYIFAILATVYIASGMRARSNKTGQEKGDSPDG